MSRDRPGLWMPAEWQPHERCWMAWPCREEIWSDGLRAPRQAWAAVARAIARHEPVTMVCRAGDRDEAESLCGPSVALHELPLDDSWMRDFGPTFVLDREDRLGAVCWRFNAWGGKFHPYDADARVSRAIADMLDARMLEPDMVLEGGAIHVDGDGTLLATTECLLHPNRNPALGRAAIESLLAAHLGVEHFIWLPSGLAQDETDGHVDNVACFAPGGRVLAAVSHDPADDDHARLAANLACLREARDARGREIEVIEVEQPEPRFKPDGSRIAQSYVNFYIANGAVVMPAFDQPARDQAAAAAVRRAFPGHEVIQLPATAIVQGGGGIHCITQQQPVAGGT